MDFKRFREIQAECADMCERKNAVYGDRSILRFGARGVVVRMMDKAERLATMVVDNHQPGRKSRKLVDSAIDAAKDMMNYSTMLVMLLDGTFEVEHGTVGPDSGRVRGRGGGRAKGRKPRT